MSTTNQPMFNIKPNVPDFVDRCDTCGVKTAKMAIVTLLTGEDDVWICLDCLERAARELRAVFEEGGER